MLVSTGQFRLPKCLFPKVNSGETITQYLKASIVCLHNSNTVQVLIF